MKQQLIWLYWLIIIILSLPARAEETLHFNYIDTKGYAVFSVLRDADDIVWLGTSNGLTTYAQLEGSRPFSYLRHPRLNDIIKRIEQDGLGRLWLETQSMDVLIYSPKTNEVITHTDQYLKQIGIDVRGRFCHRADPLGRLWIGYNNKVYLRDFTKASTRMYVFPAASGRVMEIETNDTEALVTTERHIFSISLSSGKASKVADVPCKLYYQNLYFCRDGRRNLFFATTQRCFRYDVRKKSWAALTEVNPLVVDMIPVPDGQVIVGTSNSGTYVFDAYGQLNKHLTEAPPNTNGLHSSHVEHLYFDKSKDMVLTTFHKTGISVYSHNENSYQEHVITSAAMQYKSEDLISFAEADSLSFWVGTEDNGVYRVKSDGSNQILGNYYPGTAATMVFQDSKNRLWAGLYGVGLHCSDGRTYFSKMSPFSMVEDDWGRLFVALLGMGIWMVDPETGQTTHVLPENIWLMQIAYFEGKIYGSSGNTLYVLDTHTLQIERISGAVFGENSSFCEGTRALHIDHRGWLWLVSFRNHSEVNVFDIRSQKTFRVNRLNRYVISGITEGSDGNIWCTTDLGLVRVVVKDEQKHQFDFYCYRSGNNISRRFYNDKALIRLTDGRLLAGTSTGYLLLNTEKIRKIQPDKILLSPPVITSARVNDVEISPMDSAGNALFHRDIIFARKLELGYKENNLLLECRPRGLVQSVSSLFYYQLEGSSNQWVPMDHYIIQLSNLLPGKYKLKVRRQTSQLDQWEEYDMLDIIVHKPFWNTWMAWLFYLVIALGTFYSIYSFIRHRQQYNRTIRDMKIKAAHEMEMNEMKVRFFTNVSHDLRTPLTLIMTPVEELLNTEQPPATRKVLEVVNRNARQLFTLVNQILDFQRLGSTNDMLSLNMEDIVKLVGNECAAFQLMAQQRKIRFSVHSTVQELYMPVDADKMRKVVSNLLSNSFKFTPDGGAVEVEVTTDDTHHVLIRVKDSGRGILEADREHIFERFYMSKVTRVANDSSGLGLSIVKHYVELHGGEVTAESNHPKGTVFTVQLTVPQQIGSVAVVPAPQEQPIENQTDGTVSEKRISLLLVEDSSDMLTYMSSVLVTDYLVYQATDGRQALEILRNVPIDLVVSDVMMEGMDGLELTRTIKQDVNISHIPVILLTAKALDEDELLGLQMGANDYITKPFNFDVLRLRIRQQLERRQEQRQLFAENPDVAPSEVTITTVDQELLQRALDVVNNHMKDPDFNVDQMANELGMHRTGLNRKLQAITGQTPLLFIRTLRLKRARQIIEADPAKLISQVAYEAGFNNPKKFSKYFKEEFGCYPSEFGERH